MAAPPLEFMLSIMELKSFSEITVLDSLKQWKNRPSFQIDGLFGAGFQFLLFSALQLEHFLEHVRVQNRLSEQINVVNYAGASRIHICVERGEVGD